MCAAAVIGDSGTVVIHAARLPGGRPTARLSENTAKRKRDEKPIGKLKRGVEWAEARKEKKPWMMRVQHRAPAMLICSQPCRIRDQDADFVALTGSLLPIFPVEAMVQSHKESSSLQKGSSHIRNSGLWRNK